MKFTADKMNKFLNTQLHKSDSVTQAKKAPMHQEYQTLQNKEYDDLVEMGEVQGSQERFKRPKFKLDLPVNNRKTVKVHEDGEGLPRRGSKMGQHSEYTIK